MDSFKPILKLYFSKTTNIKIPRISNSMITNEQVKRVRELIKPIYDQVECWVHSWPHVERVSNYAKELATLEGIDQNICLVAAYCHDLGRLEEEKRKQRGDQEFPHSLLSIEPTVKILQQVGITGPDFAKIVEAVAVHSCKIYSGKNEVAKVLQDADKMNGFDSYGILGGIKYFGGEDYLDPKEIIANRRDNEKMKQMCTETLKNLDGETLTKTIKGLNYLVEWWGMFHFEKSSRSMMKKHFEFLKQSRNLLASRQKS